MKAGLIIVSHSAKLAEGVAEVAAQMAPDVNIRAAGGTAAGDIGTSVELITSAIEDLMKVSSGAVVLADIGSAVMAAETALEFLDEGVPVVIADAPLVEGAVAAAAIAQGGGSIEAVRAAAESAWRVANVENPAAPSEPDTLVELDLVPPPAPITEGDGQVRKVVRLVNEMGLHARPAAQLASLATAQKTDVTVNGVNGASVIALVTLGLPPGADIVLEATGPYAQEAVDAVADLIASGFGEGSRV